MVFKGYKQFEDFVDFALDVMKSKSVTYIKVVVDDIKAFDPEFPLGKVRSLQDFLENTYAGLALPNWDAQGLRLGPTTVEAMTQGKDLLSVPMDCWV